MEAHVAMIIIAKSLGPFRAFLYACNGVWTWCLARITSYTIPASLISARSHFSQIHQRVWIVQIRVLRVHIADAVIAVVNGTIHGSI